MASRPSRSSSLADVAALAGVSAQTVSRVINHPEAVRPETAEKVRLAMEQAGYRPSFAGRSLKEGRYHSVGLALGNVTSTGNMKRVAGIMHAATAADFAVTLVEMDVHPGMDVQTVANHMSALPVDGIIINLNRQPKNLEGFVPPANLRTVLLTVLDHPSVSTADHDQEGCSEMVVDHLLSLGHRTVHHICGVDENLASQRRANGWRAALEARGVEVPELLYGDWSADSGYEAGARLARDPSCTAIYASNDSMALGVVAALRDAGLRVPEDVSVVGVDDALDGRVPHNGMTTVRFDEEGLGLWAFDKAVGLSPRGDEVERLRLPGLLVVRDTTGPVRG